MKRGSKVSAIVASLILLWLLAEVAAQKGSSVFYDFHQEKPGTIHKISINDMPPPNATKSANNFPEPFRRPASAVPKALPGFKVNLFASGLDEPRELRTAPNGDVFLAESSRGEVKVFRGLTAAGKPEQVSTFASGLKRPFGIAFYPVGSRPEWLYIGDTDSVKRFPYHEGELKAGGAATTVVAEIFPGAAHARGHWTRDVVFSPDSSKMYVSVGSLSNADDPDEHHYEFHRANILEYNPDGSGLRVFAF
ncbi:MAG: PQQ-dependent sugar dehydrogenase, partial [Acidobacteria bacterium]|nr:PQQ-dependent sugar dehydrogenase [Acidobacteriota bacterium]